MFRGPPTKLAIFRVPSPSTPTMPPGKVPQLTLQKSIDSFATLSPENRGGDVGGYYSNEEQGGQSGGRISLGQSRRSSGASDTSPTLIDSPQFDLDELWKANSHSHGTERSSTNLQNILGRNALRRVVRRINPRKLATYGMFALVLRLPWALISSGA